MVNFVSIPADHKIGTWRGMKELASHTEFPAQDVMLGGVFFAEANFIQLFAGNELTM